MMYTILFCSQLDNVLTAHTALYCVVLNLERLNIKPLPEGVEAHIWVGAAGKMGYKHGGALVRTSKTPKGKQLMYTSMDQLASSLDVNERFIEARDKGGTIALLV